MIKPIVQIGDPVLQKTASEITNILDTEVQVLINDLIDTCVSKEAITAGLSAPQIGVSSAVIICRRMDLEDAGVQGLTRDKLWEVMINPKILKVSKRESTYWEGCLSVGVGEDGLYGPVSRSNEIEISYFNAKAEIKNLKCKGFFAHIVQHEIDHLAGTIFLKYITDPDLIWKNKDLDKYYNQYGEYPPV